MLSNKKVRSASFVALVVFSAIVLGVFSTSQYVLTLGIDYLEHGNQVQRLIDVLDGHAGNPWQYRVLAPYCLEVLLKLLQPLAISNYVAITFVLFRAAQDACILLLCYAYYRKLGRSSPQALIGMAVMAWAMSYSQYDSDLSFSTFFDVIFYLLAALCVLHGRLVWIIPITLLAAMNRETSGLIPFLLVATAGLSEWRTTLARLAPIFVAACLVYVVVFVGLRLVYPDQATIHPYGQALGFQLFGYNMFRPITWYRLVATLSIVPLVAMLGYSRWPSQLRTFFWIIVPVWLTVHLFGTVLAETRMLLVPMAMVFIPGALFAMANQENGTELTDPSLGGSADKPGLAQPRDKKVDRK